MINKNISYYFNSSDSRSRIYYNFDHILELIASDTKLSKQTDMVRKQTTEKAYKEEKHRLPMIAPSGIFDYRNDDPDNLHQYSNILVLDFDDFGSHEAAQEFKEKLIQYANPLHLYAVWFSPSNKGVKAAMVHDNTNPEHHYNLFRQVKQRLYPRTDEFDKSCHNLSRTFFLSYDPDVYVNPGKIRCFLTTLNMTHPFLNLLQRVIIMVVQAVVSFIRRKRLKGIQVFRGYGRTRH